MNEMLERIKTDIMSWDLELDPARAERMAISAITALMDPIDEMLDAGQHADYSDVYSPRDELRADYKAMLKSILEPGNPYSHQRKKAMDNDKSNING